MNDISELRRVLDDRAAAVDDGVAALRPGAVHHRVAVVRRRRRAVTGTVTAAVVAGAAVWAVGSPSVDRAEPTTTVVGVDVPETMDSLGFTYDLVRAKGGTAGSVTVDLAPSAGDRLVSWATSGDDDRIALSGDLVGSGWSTNAPDFTDFTLVPAGGEGRVTVTAESGTPALAIYEMSDERPAGYTKDGITFRDQIAGGHLLAAVVGDPGQSRIEVPAVADGPGVMVQTFCIAGPSVQETVVDVGDEPGFSTGSGCSDVRPADAASWGGVGMPSRSGQDVSVRMRVTADGESVTDDDLVLAVGVYSLDADPVADPAVDSALPPEVVEFDGRRWRETGSQRAADTEELTDTAPEGGGEILAVVSATAPEVTVETFIGADSGSQRNSSGTGTVRGIVSAGETVGARVRGGGSAEGIRISFYERVG